MKTFKGFITVKENAEFTPKVFQKGDQVSFHNDLKKISMGIIVKTDSNKGIHTIDSNGVKFIRKSTEIY